MMPKKKRRSYTAQRKLEIINYAEAHGNRAASREYDIDRKMIREWIKNKTQIVSMPAGRRKFIITRRKKEYPTTNNNVNVAVNLASKQLIECLQSNNNNGVQASESVHEEEECKLIPIVQGEVEEEEEEGTNGASSPASVICCDVSPEELVQVSYGEPDMQRSMEQFCQFENRNNLFNQSRKNILLLVTGSVKAHKLPTLITTIQTSCPGVAIRLVVSAKSLRFVRLEHIVRLLPPDSVYRDEDEWSTWTRAGDPLLHVELGGWAHLGLVVPLDAHSMAQFVNGLCDNLVGSVLRGWDMGKPLLFAPGMSKAMWHHPLTMRSILELTNLGYVQIRPAIVGVVHNGINERLIQRTLSSSSSTPSTTLGLKKNFASANDNDEDELMASIEEIMDKIRLYI